MTTLTDYIKNSTGFGESTIATVMDSLNSFLTTSLRNGEEVKLEGLGNFKITDKPEREGRNPRTGKTSIFKASRKPKLIFTKSFLTSIQPDPNAVAVPTIAELTSTIPVSVNSVIPPIPADLMAPQTDVTTELSWQIKAPDGSFIEATTSELSNWGVNATTPIYSPATGWKLAGKVPELAGIVV